MSFWKVNSKEVGKLLDDWSKRETAGGKALSALGKELGAQHVGMKTSFFTGMPVSAAFIFPMHKDVDSSLWTKPDRDGYRSAKASAKDLKKRIEDVLTQFGDLSVIMDELKIAKHQFDGLTIWLPRFAKKGKTWYFTARGKYPGCALVERITDVEMERLFPKKRKQTA